MYNQHYIEEALYWIDRSIEIGLLPVDLEPTLNPRTTRQRNYSRRCNDLQAAYSCQGIFCSIKRSKDDYTKLRDPSHWVDWKRHFTTTAKAHGLDNILKHTYMPPDTDAIELFEALNRWMYYVLQELLRALDGMDVVRSCELEHYPAQKVYKTMCDLMEKSAAAKNEMQGLVQELATMTISAHRGALKDFILLFKEKANRYNRICSTGSRLQPDLLKTFLKQALSGSDHFSQITILESMNIQKGDPAMTYANYYDLVYARAQEVDTQIVLLDYEAWLGRRRRQGRDLNAPDLDDGTDNEDES